MNYIIWSWLKWSDWLNITMEVQQCDTSDWFNGCWLSLPPLKDRKGQTEIDKKQRKVMLTKICWDKKNAKKSWWLDQKYLSLKEWISMIQASHKTWVSNGMESKFLKWVSTSFHFFSTWRPSAMRQEDIGYPYVCSPYPPHGLILYQGETIRLQLSDCLTKRGTAGIKKRESEFQ